MPLSLNEIKNRALVFAREWEDATAERAEAQTFWNEFFNVFGITRRRVASFEEPVRRAKNRFEQSGSKGGFIDLFWRGVLIAEHKSLGKNLDSAYEQALNYFEGLNERDLPRYVIVSDFSRIRLYDLEADTNIEFPLKDLYRHIKTFGFIAGYTTHRIEAQDPVNIKAAELMGKLHDRLRLSGYSGHALEVLLVRLLFCLFADDTTLFEPKGSFRDFLENCTKEDGSDLGSQISMFFQVLNTPVEKRQINLDEMLKSFPYVNGRLFEEILPIASCDRLMREILLDCCSLDWGKISPAIFGALFQCVMDEEGSERRRNIGAHYTSEENILKVIKPLFLDSLWSEFHSAKKNINKLFELHKKISRLRFLDPACGCGNFLVVAYREIRMLEIEILRTIFKAGQRYLDIFHLVQVGVEQFYGIEIEEFPSQIAQVALWLTDHQMNMLVSEEFGQYYHRLPLINRPNIICANALRIDWNDVLSAYEVDYIFGNPPFVGKQHQSSQQKADMDLIFKGINGAGVLDYVSAWYMKAVNYIKGDNKYEGLIKSPKNPKDHVKVAFVSTNSIAQGEQVGVLWSELIRKGVKIHFAHRTFQWSNEARGKAAVHCVIIGFALHDTNNKIIYDYPNIKGTPHSMSAKNINPYLVDAPDVVLTSRREPICPMPAIVFGSMPNDGGNLLLSDEQKRELISKEPNAEKWIRPFVGADEFLYNTARWCLWLKNISPDELKAMPLLLRRVQAVREHRLQSKRETTRALASYPTLFGEDRHPENPYVLIPRVSSENRQYIPIGFMPSTTIASDATLIIPNATLYHFGLLSSAMHMAWLRYVAGRLESRYRYSAQIVYNNFPIPKDTYEKHQDAVSNAAQGVLDARASHPNSTLADLYDPIAMPPNLHKAHQRLDNAVDSAYGRKNFSSDTERVEFLFELYHQYTSLFQKPKKTRKTLT